jgi:hypothetical protein
MKRKQNMIDHQQYNKELNQKKITAIRNHQSLLEMLT